MLLLVAAVQVLCWTVLFSIPVVAWNGNVNVIYHRVGRSIGPRHCSTAAVQVKVHIFQLSPSSSNLCDETSISSKIARDEAELLEKLHHVYNKEDLLRTALHFWRERGHLKEQKQEKHSLGVASILVDLKLDEACVITGILQAALTGRNVQDEDNEEGLDTSLYLNDVEEIFGSEVRFLVKSVVDLETTLLPYHHRMQLIQQEQQQNKNEQQQRSRAREAENYRKLILSMTARDIRVVLVKLADQTQTLRLLAQDDHTSTSTQHQQRQRVARETLDLYAPLAHRLGMYTLKTEMEDTSLRLWKPEVFRQLQDMVSARQAERQQYTSSVIRLLEERLTEGDLQILGAATTSTNNNNTVTGRAKSYYSIYQKMQNQKVAFDDIHDLMAFRILVDDVTQCYQALGIIHAHWKPVPGRFKDYIAAPKPNGYQSLHTTVIGSEGKRMEVQIRTQDMHIVAEGGIAAHWMYKDKAPGQAATKTKQGSISLDAQRYKWLRQLVEWAQQRDDDDSKGKPVSSTRDDNIDCDVYDEKDVFVFSPNEQLFALTKGATVLDFAYLVHSQVGHQCVGAKVNGKMVPLKHAVTNGDTVEILQSSSQKPSQEWLNIVQTSKARGRIKSWLNKAQVGEDSLLLAREMLEKGFRKYDASKREGWSGYKKKLHHLVSVFELPSEHRLLMAIASGQISVAKVLEEVFGAPPPSKGGSRLATNSEVGEGEDIVLGVVQENPKRATADGLVVGGKRNILISFCRNCNALYGEDVQGVVTQGRGVKVHRLDCRYLMESDPLRRVDTVWDKEARTTKRALVLEVLFEDAPGMLAGMSKAISTADVNIGGVVLKTLSNTGQGLARFELIMSSIEDLQRVTLHLQKVAGVINVKRR